MFFCYCWFFNIHMPLASTRDRGHIHVSRIGYPTTLSSAAVFWRQGRLSNTSHVHFTHLPLSNTLYTPISLSLSLTHTPLHTYLSHTHTLHTYLSHTHSIQLYVHISPSHTHLSLRHIHTHTTMTPISQKTHSTHLSFNTGHCELEYFDVNSSRTWKRNTQCQSQKNLQSLFVSYKLV